MGYSQDSVSSPWCLNMVMPASSSPSTFWSQELPYYPGAGDYLSWEKEKKNLRNMCL